MKKLVFLVLALLMFSCHRENDSEQPELQQIDLFLEGAFAKCPTGGVVLVARQGKSIFTKAYGIADLELDVPMTIDHVLAIGSITKQFTAVMILKLVEAGQLTLDDDVRHYVPELETHGRTISIAQVLTHTSGLFNFVDLPNFQGISLQHLTPLEILKLTKDKPLTFEPGTKYAYSDSGYILLGLIIERVSGHSYSDFLENEICRPVGMRNTWYPDGKRIIPNMVKGYSVSERKVVHADYINMCIPYSAGAIYSSVGDLLIWSNALKNGKIVADSLLKKAWTSGKLPDGTLTGYGFGWELDSLMGKSTREHGGFLNGFYARLFEVPEEEIVIAVLVNNDADDPEPGFIARSIARILLK